MQWPGTDGNERNNQLQARERRSDPIWVRTPHNDALSTDERRANPARRANAYWIKPCNSSISRTNNNHPVQEPVPLREFRYDPMFQLTRGTAECGTLPHQHHRASGGAR